MHVICMTTLLNTRNRGWGKGGGVAWGAGDGGHGCGVAEISKGRSHSDDMESLQLHVLSIWTILQTSSYVIVVSITFTKRGCTSRLKII